MEAFRLFNKETKKRHEITDSSTDDDIILLSPDGRLLKYSRWTDSPFEDVTSDYTRCDYIGIKDKNGQMLYDKDRVKFTVKGTPFVKLYAGTITNTIKEEKIMIIEKDECNPCFCLVNIKNKDDVEYDFIRCNMAEIERIGSELED